MGGNPDNLGIAYNDLPTGDCGENLRRAIDCYEAALGVFSRKRRAPGVGEDPEQPGDRVLPAARADNRGEDVRRAIECYEEAGAAGNTEEAAPQDWAMTQEQLGTAY